MNPVRAGIVSKATHYMHSCASNYVDDEGIITIMKADNPIIDVLKLSSIRNNYIW
jgi:hypothetical protein